METLWHNWTTAFGLLPDWTPAVAFPLALLLVVYIAAMDSLTRFVEPVQS
jgi:hypothetical protein